MKGSLNHLGVEVGDVETVDAEQDKFWVQGAPNGESWEVYTVLADSETFGAVDGPCCGADAADEDESAAVACC